MTWLRMKLKLKRIHSRSRRLTISITVRLLCLITRFIPRRARARAHWIGSRQRRSRPAAHRLYVASVIYLALMCVLLVVDRIPL